MNEFIQAATAYLLPVVYIAVGLLAMVLLLALFKVFDWIMDKLS